MKYAFCTYLLANVDLQGNIIIFNTLFRNSVVIKKEDLPKFSNLVKQIIETGNYLGPSSNIQQFLDQKIIVCTDDLNIDRELNRIHDDVFNSKNELMLTVLPTQQCNFRCAYCYEEFKDTKMSQEVIDKICSLVDKFLDEYNALHLCWFGGEPLLSLDVIEILTRKISAICRKHKKPYYASMTTNGYLLNLDTFNFLLKQHVMQFQVTLDGDRHTHNKQRVLRSGKETYDVILNNLLNIKEHIRTSTIKIIVRINLADKIDFNQIQELIDLFADDNRFVINIQKIFATQNSKETTNETYFSALTICDTHKPEELLPEHTICYAAKGNTLVISADGTMGKCTVNFEDPKNQFGNIVNCDLDSFSLDSMQYSNSIHSNKECKQCCIYPLCFGKQCPARSVQLCSDIIDKYKLIIKNYTSKSKVISLEN